MLRPGSHRTTDEQARLGLLRRYARLRRPEDLEALVRSYRPLALALARRYATATASREDLEQVACEGLIKAIPRFEPDRGAPFTSFAVPTILGEMRRHLRDTAWPARVPRSLQERVHAVRTAAEELSGRHGRSPTVRELALALECDEEEIVEALAVPAALSVVPLDAPVGDSDDAPVTDRVGADDPGFECVECLATIEEAIPALTSDQKSVLRLHFEEDLTQAADRDPPRGGTDCGRAIARRGRRRLRAVAA